MDTFGWDLVFKVYKDDLKRKEDVLAIVVHYCLIKNGWKCKNDEDETSSPSELLPEGWNESANYSIKYIRNNISYLLRGELLADQNIVFNFLNSTNLDCSNVVFFAQIAVRLLTGSLHQIFYDPEEVFKKVQTELIDMHKTETNCAAATQTEQKQERRSNWRPVSPCTHLNPLVAGPDPDFLRDYGRRDLDIFARGQGGMLMTPGRPRFPLDPGAGLPEGLPRGSVPPGARFDPFGPDIGGRYGPDYGRGGFGPGWPPL